jgi:hypothetical protein
MTRLADSPVFWIGMLAGLVLSVLLTVIAAFRLPGTAGKRSPGPGLRGMRWAHGPVSTIGTST